MMLNDEIHHQPASSGYHFCGLNLNAQPFMTFSANPNTKLVIRNRHLLERGGGEGSPKTDEIRREGSKIPKKKQT